MRAVLSNMGFIMQISGIFIILPIIASFILKETSATIALFITATIFLVAGFIFNALCERKELSFRGSCTLIVLVFVFLSLIGAFPYYYLNIFDGNLLSKFSNSFFEAASGFTTTGFSVIENLSTLPKSILLYRGLTQFIGGIGIVLILLIFFYPEERLRNFSKGMGFDKNTKIKKTFLIILVTYCFYTIILSTIFFLFGYRHLINSLSFVFSSLSTGGFAPVGDITNVATAIPGRYILVIGMLIGASNFLVLARLIKFKIKEFFTSEIALFLVMAIISITVVKSVFHLPIFDAIFHTISSMSTTGFSYINMQSIASGLKLFFSALMFVGGASFSTAGGIKLYRFVLIFKALGKVIKEGITERDARISLFGREYSNIEIIQSLVVIILMGGFILVSSYIFFLNGFNFIDSVFETTSAISTSGLSVGIVSATLALKLKWLITALMILGRVEILAFFIMLSPVRSR